MASSMFAPQTRLALLKPTRWAPPDKRHTILGCDAGAIERIANLRIALRRDEATDGDAAYVVAAALLGHLFSVATVWPRSSSVTPTPRILTF
jgi:hypothetical protein